MLCMRSLARCALLATFGLALVLGDASAPRADIRDGSFHSETWRVSMSLPKNWQASEQTSYPNILVWMSRRQPDAKMLLSAEAVDPSLDAQGYTAETVERLERFGFEVRGPQLHAATGAYWMDLDDGRTFLRQAILVVDGIGYSLTVAARDAGTRGQLLRAFDQALRSIRPLREPRDAP